MNTRRLIPLGWLLGVAALLGACSGGNTGDGPPDDVDSSVQDAGIQDAGVQDAGAEDAGSMLCTPGESSPCYSGTVATRNVGECTDGLSLCPPDGTPGACMGEQLPAAETCADIGDDNDCDGVSNEVEDALGVDRSPGASCDTGLHGPCAAGTWSCLGTYATCETTYVAEAEDFTCDMVDEDCDGELDDEAEQPDGQCYDGAGLVGCCGGACVPLTDSSNCGDCNIVCGVGQACCVDLGAPYCGDPSFCIF